MWHSITDHRIHYGIYNRPLTDILRRYTKPDSVLAGKVIFDHQSQKNLKPEAWRFIYLSKHVFISLTINYCDFVPKSFLNPVKFLNSWLFMTVSFIHCMKKIFMFLSILENTFFFFDKQKEDKSVLVSSWSAGKVRGVKSGSAQIGNAWSKDSARETSVWGIKYCCWSVYFLIHHVGLHKSLLWEGFECRVS